MGEDEDEDEEDELLRLALQRKQEEEEKKKKKKDVTEDIKKVNLGEKSVSMPVSWHKHTNSCGPPLLHRLYTCLMDSRSR